MRRAVAAALLALLIGLAQASASEFALTVVSVAAEQAHAGNTAPDGYEYRLAIATVAGDAVAADAALSQSQAEDPDGFPNAITIEPTTFLDRRIVVVLIDKATTALDLVLPNGQGRLTLSEGATLAVGAPLDRPDGNDVTVSRDGIDYSLGEVATSESAGGQTAPDGQLFVTADIALTNRTIQGLRQQLASLVEIVEDGRFPYALTESSRQLAPEAFDNHLYEPNLPVSLKLVFLVPVENGHLELIVHSPTGAAHLPLDEEASPTPMALAGPSESGQLAASLLAAIWEQTAGGRALTVDIDLALTSDNPLEVVDIPADLVSLVDASNGQWLPQAGAPLRRPLKAASLFGGGESVLGGALRFVLPQGAVGPFKLRVGGVNPAILLPVPEEGAPVGPVPEPPAAARSYAEFTADARNAARQPLDQGSIEGAEYAGSLFDGSLADDPWARIYPDAPMLYRFPRPLPLEGMRLKLWNGDPRSSSVLIEGSPDGVGFEVLADLREPPVHDVVDLDLRGRAYAALRFSGQVTDDDDKKLYPTELELWTRAPDPLLARGGRIDVLSATRNGNCGAPVDNALRAVKSYCDGKGRCDFAFDDAALGAAIENCSGNAEVLWQCDGQVGTFVNRLYGEPSGTALPLVCIGGAPSLALAEPVIYEQSPIRIQLRGMPEGLANCITIAEPGSASDQQLRRACPADADLRKGDVDISLSGLPVGEYEIRAFADWGGSGAVPVPWMVQARLPLKVLPVEPVTGGRLALVRDRLFSGDPITVIWRGFPGGESDTIDLARAGDSDNNSINYIKAHGARDGRVSFEPVPPGDYQIRGFFNHGDSGAVQERLAFTVGPAPVLRPFEPAVIDGLIDVASVRAGALADMGELGATLSDGNVLDYGRNAGFASLSPGGANRVLLARPYPIEKVRLITWDGDQRLYTYSIEGSPDAINWEPIGSAVSEPGGTHDFATGGRTFIAFRLTGLSVQNSENEWFAAVGFAALAKPENAIEPARWMPPEPSFADWQAASNPALDIAHPAFGSTAFANDGDARLNDGLINGWARANAETGELGIRFAQAYHLDRVVVQLASSNGETYRFKVEGAAADGEWSALADRMSTDQSSTVEIDVHGSAAIDRLRLTGRGTAPGVEPNLHVLELEAYTSDLLPMSHEARTLDVRDDVGGNNLALFENGGRVLAASSTTDPSGNFGWLRGSPASVVDGVRRTAWEPAIIDQLPSIVVSLPGDGPALINAVELYLSDRYYPRLVDLYVASDTKGWQLVGRYGNNTDKMARLEFPPLSASAIALRFPAGYRESIAISEVIVREAKSDGYVSVIPNRRPDFLGGLNVAATMLGGTVAAYGARSPDPYDAGEIVVDGIYLGWGYHGAEGSPETPYVTVDLAGDDPAIVGGIAFSPAAGIAAFTTDADWVSRADVWLSNESATTGFEWVGRYRLDWADKVSVFSFAPRPARFARVVLLGSNRYALSNIHAGLGEFEVLEEPGVPSVGPARGPNLVDFRYGGHMVVPAGDRRQSLIDSRLFGNSWYDSTGLRPVTFTLGFRNSEARTISSIGINPWTEYAPESWARRVKVLVSDDPTSGFRTLGELQLSPESRVQYLDFPPITARYVQLRLLESGGDRDISMGDVYVHEAAEPGTLSSVARLADPLPPMLTFSGPVVDLPLTGLLETEVNGSVLAANPLPMGSWISGRVDPISDEDWFAFEPTTRAITLSVEENPSLRVGLKLSDNASNLLADLPLYDTNGGRADLSFLLEPGRYAAGLSRNLNSIVVIVDRSESVSAVRPDIAAAAMAFAASANPDEAISFVSMDGAIFNDFSTDREVLIEGARQTGQGGGGSGVYDSISQAIARLEERAGNKAVVIVTDGEDSGGSGEPLFALWRTLAETGVRVYTIGYGPASIGQLGDLGSTGGDMLRNFSIATGGRHFLAPNGAAMSAIYAEIAGDLGNRSTYRLRADPSPGAGTLALQAAEGKIKGVSAPTRIALIFDASGSMGAKTSTGETRMESAKAVLRNVIDQLPDGTDIALRLYGHRLDKDPKEASCADTELAVPFGPLDRARVLEVIDGIEPRGQTPLGRSLAQLAADFANTPGRKVAILITDGIESCATEPSDEFYPPKVVETLRAADIDLKVNVVSLDIPADESQTRALLESIAVAGDGQYFDAEGADELSKAIEESFRIGFAVTDTLGAELVHGKVGDPPVVLPSGYWRIILDTAPPQDLGIQQVLPGENRTISLVPEGDGFVVVPNATP